jgi:hypothetical protein
MIIAIVNRQTGNMSHYRPAELRKMAAAHVKGKGKLTDYWVKFEERDGRAALVAQYKMADGWSTSESIAL